MEVKKFVDIPQIESYMKLFKAKNSGRKTVHDISCILEDFHLTFGMSYTEIVNILKVKDWHSAKKKWIKEKGHKLHPRFTWVTDKKGEYHCSKKYYPKNAILKQLREEKIADEELIWATYKYRLKGGELEFAGYEFNDDWKKGLSIDEIVYHL
jgi:hypothetical protein